MQQHSNRFSDLIELNVYLRKVTNASMPPKPNTIVYDTEQLN